jgi:hypothetical protein
VTIGGRARRRVHAVRAEVAPLNARFVGPVRITSFGKAVARNRGSILCHPLTLGSRRAILREAQVVLESSEAVDK